MEIFCASEISSGKVTLGREESAHCIRVLRHKVGDSLNVMDGTGNLYHCRLVSADTDGAVAAIESVEEGFGGHPYKLVMAVCPTKNIDRYEWFCEKVVEIGVDEIVPVIGDHSERKVVKKDRLERLALSAAKQSLKARVPEIADPVSVKDYLLSAPESALRLIAYCRDERKDIGEFLPAVGERPEIHILIGPEGDFSEEEVRLALERGWKATSLGASRLRTETAAVVAATAVYLKQMHWL